MTVDLRSDVCAPPTEEMWEAMRAAPVGSASLGEDANVVRLEALGAELLGKQAAVFTPTCTVANLVAVLALAPGGGRAALDERAHILVNEGDWLTELAGLTPVGLDEAESAEVLCLENTQTRRAGAALTPEATAALAARAARTHLDGARLPNAAVALGVPLAALAAPCDTVAMSLNKGLCAPFGALLAGDADTIAAARIQLKRVGAGTVHKAGLLAAAGIVALGLVDRLDEDHRRARELARLIGAEPPATNLVYTDLDPAALGPLEQRGVLGLEVDGRVRFATHRGIDDAAVERAGYAIAELGRTGR